MAKVSTTPVEASATGGEPEPDGLKDGGNWIAKAVRHSGALHRQLHVAEGEKIPAKLLTKAEHSGNPVLRKRAVLAKTLKGLH